MPAVVVSFIVMSAVIFAVTTLAFPLTASDAGIVTFAIVFTVTVLTLPLAPINTGVVTDTVVFAMTAFTFAVTTPVIATGHGAVANVRSVVTDALMDGSVRHGAAAAAHPHAGRAPATRFTGAAGKQR
jgi:hypothetical protein